MASIYYKGCQGLFEFSDLIINVQLIEWINKSDEPPMGATHYLVKICMGSKVYWEDFNNPQDRDTRFDEVIDAWSYLVPVSPA